ncbi:MAG: omptin family outer membrane protease [Candidatus Omnitrophica bacterium]|nr:omptin family outer membrane protease [Candidatus Omnitrophota bacterium]
MKNRCIYFFILFLFYPLLVFSNENSVSREKIISDYLDRYENIRDERLTLIDKSKDIFAQLPKKTDPGGSSPQEKSERKEGIFKDLREDIQEFLGGKDYYAAFSFLRFSYIKGDQTYHTSFDNSQEYGGHGESELEWELDNILCGVGLTLGYRYDKDEKRDKAKLYLEFLTNVDKKTGIMKDSDWIEYDVEFLDAMYDLVDDGLLNGSDSAPYPTWNQSGKDIYSESDVKMDRGNVFDIYYLYNFIMTPKMSLGFLGGYKYQKFELSAWNANQVGYGPYANDFTFTDTNNWKWGIYETRQHIPYIGVNLGWYPQDKLKLDFKFAYSDWIRIKDKDIHLYPDSDVAYGYDRDMVSKASLKGDVYLGEIVGSWNFLPQWSFNLGAGYTKIDTKGKIHQEHYIDGILFAISEESIYDKVTSKYWMINSSISYQF